MSSSEPRSRLRGTGRTGLPLLPVLPVWRERKPSKPTTHRVRLRGTGRQVLPLPDVEYDEQPYDRQAHEKVDGWLDGMHTAAYASCSCGWYEMDFPSRRSSQRAWRHHVLAVRLQ